ncbi:hypothetical protein WA538_003307 [Blastocystis sp. DL]
MKKVVYSFFIAFCLLSVAEAAKKKPTYFNVYEELQGSWMATQMTVSITTGAPIGSSEQKMYNITQNVVPQELLISEVDASTKEEIRKPFQTILSVSSNFTAAINRFEPGADVEMTKKYDIHFREFLTQEVFYASGSLEEAKSHKFEITLLPNELVKFEVDVPEKNERVITVAKKVIVEKPKTFMQKYASYFIIGFAILVQLITTNMQNPMA